jgi:hypothetical protein
VALPQPLYFIRRRPRGISSFYGQRGIKTLNEDISQKILTPSISQSSHRHRTEFIRFLSLICIVIWSLSIRKMRNACSYIGAEKNHQHSAMAAAETALMFLAEKETRAAGLRETRDGSPICNLNYIKRACQFKLRAAALLVIHIRDS